MSDMRRKKTSLIPSDEIDFDTKERGILIDQLTRVVNDFLRKTSRHFKDWSVVDVISDREQVIFCIDNSGIRDCFLGTEHYTEVTQYLPKFDLKAPISNFSRRDAASIRICELVYNINQGERGYKSHKRIQFGIGVASIITLLGFLFFVGTFIKHTENDADRFAALWQ